MIVTLQDMRKVKFCSGGARRFFARHNLDWQQFIKSGIEEEKLIATGDAMALKVVEVAHGRKQ